MLQHGKRLRELSRGHRLGIILLLGSPSSNLVASLEGLGGQILDPISVNILDWDEDNVGRNGQKQRYMTQPFGPGFSTKIPPAKRIRKPTNDYLQLSFNGPARSWNVTLAHKARWIMNWSKISKIILHISWNMVNK